MRTNSFLRLSSLYFLYLYWMNNYSEIPDTSDSHYWMLKITNNGDRSTTFVPRNRELHQELKIKAWKVIQSKQNKRARSNA
jgi:hypothetical protein